MTSEELVALCPELTLRKLDHWCHKGMFGLANARPGRGTGRDFNDQDKRIAEVVAYVAGSIELWNGSRGGAVDIYVKLAEYLRSGGTVITIALRHGVTLTVDTTVIP